MSIHNNQGLEHGQARSASFPVEAGRRDALIVDLISEADRIYFEDHPNASEYTRMYVPGEAGVEMDAINTVVRQLQGFRIREFILPAEVEAE